MSGAAFAYPTPATQIQAGDSLPDVTLKYVTPAGETEATNVRDLFAGKKAVLFGVPGAFTPTCSNNHLPGFIEKMDDLQAKGVELVACVSVNDIFVMKAWGEAKGATGKVTMLADGSAELAAAMGLLVDKSGSGMGCRNKRFMAVLEDGKVSTLKVDDKGMANTGVEQALEAL